MRRLVILRHAKSEWPEGVPDHLRPLAERGRRDAPAAGRWLADEVGAIDLAVCSPASRARQTWELAAAELPNAPELRIDERIYDAWTGDLVAVVTELPPTAATAVLIGHNPGLSMLVGALSGVHHELKTSGIAVLTWTGSWADASQAPVELVATGKPRG